MKYIGNAFSTSMVGEALIKINTITKDEFVKAGETAHSIIGHPEIAKNFGLPLNRESVVLNKGDVLFVVTPARRPMENQNVQSGTKYEFVPETEGYSYKRVEILE